MSNNVTVETSKYEFAHGRAPRGSGTWAFHPNWNVDASSPEIFWHNGTWGEAKKAAKAHFKGKAMLVYVLS